MRTFTIPALVGALIATMSISKAADAQTCLAQGAAADCAVQATASLTVPTLLRLTIGSSTTPFGTLTAANYDLGTVAVAGPSVVVKANVAWRVQISSAAAFWTAVSTVPSTPARTTKPLSDLRWGPSVSGSFTAMSGTGAQIGAGTRTGGTSIPLAFQSAWDYALDTPGNYSVNITFTLLSP